MKTLTCLHFDVFLAEYLIAYIYIYLNPSNIEVVTDLSSESLK